MPRSLCLIDSFLFCLLSLLVALSLKACWSVAGFHVFGACDTRHSIRHKPTNTGEQDAFHCAASLWLCLEAAATFHTLFCRDGSCDGAAGRH